MTSDQVQLIRETFPLVARRPDLAALLFYKRLFEIDPSLRHLFRPDIEEQGRKLMQMLNAAVQLLEQPDTLMPVLENLGRRHVGYGVRDEHYDTVGEALLWTLNSALGDFFTPNVREAWASLYGFIAATMKRAALGELQLRPALSRPQQTVATAR